ncbi:MAG: type II toxin-antitoxin system RelE/ParE family toxin [Proteobacteria bacterium]|nr:type II toxin-antitoxin system RelE/ParE family toxin [Pseudomonadota bacterium]
MARDPSGDPIQADWVGPSKRDLLGFPKPVVRGIGQALSVAQFGGRHPSAKSLRGFGSGVFEIVENHRGATNRAVYTVRFEDRLDVLHCFQKKSKKGVKTPRHDIDSIEGRLKRAQTDYEHRQRKRRARE